MESSATSATPTAASVAITNLVKDLARRDAKVQRGKRVSARYSLNAPLKLGTRGDDQTVKPLCEAWGMDLSLQGIGMLTQVELLPGRVICVNLQNLTGSAGWVAVRIIYSQKLVGTMVRSGGVFIFEPGE